MSTRAEQINAAFDALVQQVVRQAKAEALREAAEHWQERAAYALTEDWLNARADRIARGEP